MITLSQINTEADKADTLASDAQREAGNYRKGHISVKGMRIAIENPKGSRRYYNNGRKYNVMKNHYGYFNITKGKDGDAVDVFLGPDIENFENVYCIDQKKPNGEFDETKVMLGFTSKEDAKNAYMSNYDENWKGFGEITAVSLDDFKKWLYRGRKQRQPFADYVYIQKKKLDEMKKVVKLNESDITGIVMDSVKRALNEVYNVNDVADMLGADDSHDGPTNEGPDWDEQVYYKALSIMKKFDFGDDIAIESLEHTMYDYLDGAYKSERIMKMSPDEAGLEMAKEAMRRVDAEYYDEEIEPLLSEKKVIKLNENDIARIVRESVKHVLMESKYMHSLDYSYPTLPDDDEEQDYKYEQWLKQQGLITHEPIDKDWTPTQKDWDDFGFWASKDESRLDYDEMDPYVSQQEAEYLNGPHDVYPVDADDEGSGFSRDYDAGVEYAKNLIAKSNVPENAVKELKEKESNGTISAFEIGILDTLGEE